MVLKRRLDYGFNGYQVPVVPRAPRSIRRRCLNTKPVEDAKLCTFELLAAVAGKFLQESESSTSSNAAVDIDQLFVKTTGVKLEQAEEDKACGSENHDRGSCVESAFVTEPAAHEYNFNSNLKELPHAESDIVLENVSSVKNSYLSKDVGSHIKLELCTSKNAVEKFPERGSSDNGKSCVGDTGNVTGGQMEAVEKQTGDMTVSNSSSSKDSMELCVNTHTLINFNTTTQLPLYGDQIPTTSSATRRNDVELGVRDDDEFFFRCNKPSTKIRSFRYQSRVRQRVRKFLTSKCCKVAPKLKDFDLSPTDGEMRPFCHNTKKISTPERCERDAPFKKRKLFEHSSSIVYDAEASGESISNSPDMGFQGNLNDSTKVPHKGHPAFFQSKDSRVKLSIKSFRVPELYIDVPETATIGSLKRMVLKSISTVLGGGLHVGVLLQGKKVRDDSRTLLETGISHSGNLDLGFTLEPSFEQAPSVPKDALSLLPCDAHQQLLRSPACSTLESGFSNTSFYPCPVNNMDNHVKSNCEVFPSYNDIQMNEAASDSKALVPIPELNTEALAIVPMNQRPKCSEFSQRRTRRPFSVPEVEALVEAVEQLGTGRWRDVKMRAFDNADHRTYVDLKDKWKTLVHTASISPRQRRGEPVPQVLLDRVLAAHAFWSRHQSKQHGKPQAEPLKISETQVEGVGA